MPDHTSAPDPERQIDELFRLVTMRWRRPLRPASQAMLRAMLRRFARFASGQTDNEEDH